MDRGAHVDQATQLILDGSAARWANAALAEEKKNSIDVRHLSSLLTIKLIRLAGHRDGSGCGGNDQIGHFRTLSRA